MPEPLFHQILTRFVTDLTPATRPAGTYQVNPDLVLLVDTYDDPRIRDASLAAVPIIFAVRPGASDSQHRWEATGDGTPGSIRRTATAEVFVLVARRFVPSSPADDPDAVKWRERMLADVEQAITRDPTLGGLADDISSDAIVKSRDFYEEGWVAGELVFPVTYPYPVSTP